MFTAMPPIILCLAIFLLLASSFTKGAENNIIRCNERERQALLAFKQSIVQDNGRLLSSWGSHKECCKWWGVRCNNVTGHVISLDLHGNLSTHKYLSAPKVSPSLLELKHLSYLDLSYNEFQWSSIPEFIGSFKRLRVLSLHNANFAGAIPSHLGNLTNLNTLLLSQNLLNETIAELLEKLARGGAGKSLQVLGLSGNELTGKLPANMSTAFVSLRELHARLNLMSGYLPPLPSSLEQLDLAFNNFDRVFQDYTKGFGKKSSNNLMKLDLSYNLLTGPFPDLSDFLSLRVLNLSGNMIQGGLSETIGKLSKLQVLRAKANSLEGVITEAHFWNLSSIQKMDLSLNPGLSFNFSDDWVPPFHTLNSLVLASCKVGPKFPKWLQNQSLFSEIDISSASISDTLPHWFWDLISPNLRYLNLSYNTIDGTLPDLSNKLSPFSIIDLSFNKFSGPISKFVGGFLILNLSNNKFVGSISFLCSVISQNTLSIDLSYNHFSGKIPDCWNSNISNLAIINFASNGFIGEVPHSLGSLPRLQSLHLRSNNFSGELPSSFQNFMSLKVMDLEGNKFIGKIPTWIGSYLTNLTVLSLRNNNFNGSMPESLCHLKNIHFLDLSQNKLTGRISSCFNNFTTLIQSTPIGSTEISYFTITGDIDYPAFYIDDVFVQWKNKDAKFNKQLGFLNCIDLSSNKLSGNIPEELYALKELVSLNLSRNHLTGKIFPSIYKMENLESLDLSRNQLSGEIPSSLALLTFLGVLDLSNNFLSGKIPKGTQLQTFNASSYAGNHDLCGDPLPKCPADVPPHGKSNDDYKEDDDNLVDQEFYISMVLGFSISFWGLVVSLVLSDKWRLAYYGFFNDVKDALYMNMKICLMRVQRKFMNT